MLVYMIYDNIIFYLGMLGSVGIRTRRVHKKLFGVGGLGYTLT